MSLRSRALAVALVAVWLAAPRAWAGLGQAVESVAADQRQFGGQVQSVTGSAFSLYEIASADGNTVREYASPAGVVFGVTWSGPTVPDLAQLLGPYFEEFRVAARAPVRRRQPLIVRTQHLVFENGGHVRAFRGRVYLPNLVPASASPAAIR